MIEVKPRTLILNLYGAYVRPLGGWLAVADLIRLMSQLGHDEQVVRSALSRMKQAGLLTAEKRGGVAGYRLTDEASSILREGDERIFKVSNVADVSEGWVVAVFSVPEKERDRRYQLRSRLASLGYGQVASGVWIAPRRMLSDTKRTLSNSGLTHYVDLFEGAYAGFEETVDLVARAWDHDTLKKLYTAFLRQHERVLNKWEMHPDREDGEAFVDYTLAVSEWRRLSYMNPGLPPELFPPDWEGERARALFHGLTDRLEFPAVAHVLAIVRERGRSAPSGQEARAGAS